MEDKEQEVKELNYKVTFRDLKPRICVYGIDRGRKELYSQKALITWDMQIKAGYLPPPSDYPDKKAEPNRISNFKMTSSWD